ncbi:hypothetical protein SAMN05660733_05645 [Lentzea albidocapillata]|uniref:Uncharacterized protein n=1 Tax=Lentzea albidocapillata TaxID=40571 RepID=A0A1W2FD61_9PSEU|nr:hypothetical protein SAMN05660733_05645 [Lentzea albidocapillata]
MVEGRGLPLPQGRGGGARLDVFCGWGIRRLSVLGGLRHRVVVSKGCGRRPQGRGRWVAVVRRALVAARPPVSGWSGWLVGAAL